MLKRSGPNRRLARRLTMGVGVLLVGSLMPTLAKAQAICSGPHAGPGRPTAGAIATAQPGAGWIQATFFHHGADSYYDGTGDQRAFGSGGSVQTRSVFLTGSVGIVPGMDVMAQIPVHSLEFSDATGTRSRTGIGDPRLYLRISPELVGFGGVPLAVRGGVKLTGSKFPVDSRIIPITEGQRDWEVMVESGHALAALPLYVRGWVGYRWREANLRTDQEPGNERFGYFALGGPIGRLGWEIAIEGLSGETPQQIGFDIPSARRSLIQLYPGLSTTLGPGQVELGARVPLTGRNFPTGAGASVGYSWRWGGL